MPLEGTAPGVRPRSILIRALGRGEAGDRPSAAPRLPARRESRQARSLAGALTIVALLAMSLAVETAPPGLASDAASAANEVLRQLQISAAGRQRLEGGGVASYAVRESSERELATGLALLVPSAVDRVADALAAGELIAQDTGISASGVLPDRAGPDTLPGVRFSRAERREAEALLQAAPGTRFNLSAAEIEALRRLAASLVGAGEDDRLARVSDEYRRLLRGRWIAYRAGGLPAVAPYARADGGLTEPAADLARGADDVARLAGAGGTAADALRRYPAAAPLAVDRFYWIKRWLQGRPALSLLHQLLEARAAAVVHVERYVYVGHSYNAAQLVTVGLAHRGGTLVLSTSRISTDEVLGRGNQLKRAIGRKQLEDDMRGRLERFRAAVVRSAPATLQSP
jgi:hypothetical protein